MGKIHYIIFFMLSACVTVEEPKPPVEFGPCELGFNKNQHKRKAPPKPFLNDLFAFVRDTCGDNELYGKNNEPRDAFSHLSSELGISGSSPIKLRCAAMFELLRVSAAMESSFNWQEGRDKSASNKTYYTMESGIFQSAPNTHVYAHKGTGYQRWKYLDDLMAPIRVHISDEPANKEWNALMKDESKKRVILEHHAFMLRHNFRHYGPVIDKARVGANIDKECIKKIEPML